MFEILGLYGIPPPILNAIKLRFTNNTSTVLSPDGETTPIYIKAGILQGDTLAPFLFIIVVDYILRMSLDQSKHNGLEIKPRTSSRHPAEYITDMDFPDDISLITQGQSLRDNATVCADILTSIINKDFSNSSFPDKLKNADVTPIYKGKKTDPTDKKKLQANKCPTSSIKGIRTTYAITNSRIHIW